MKPKVAILLSHYNGFKYLDEQVESILCQTGISPYIFLRDDGSTCSESLSLLKKYEKNSEVSVIYGQNLGVTKSFFELVQQADGFEYFSFADQDDVWLPDKLQNAMRTFSEEERSRPQLYCSALTFADENLTKIKKFSVDYKIDFKNVLFKNVCTGCTTVFNNSLREVFVKHAIPKAAVLHDWWFCLLALMSGDFLYDKESHILYRQHGNNVVGADQSPFKTMLTKGRKSLMQSSGDSLRLKQAQELLALYRDSAKSESVDFLEFFIKSKDSFSQRLSLSIRKELNIGHFSRTLLLRLAVLLGKY